MSSKRVCGLCCSLDFAVNFANHTKGHQPTGEKVNLKTGGVRVFFICQKTGKKYHYDIVVSDTKNE